MTSAETIEGKDLRWDTDRIKDPTSRSAGTFGDRDVKIEGRYEEREMISIKLR